MIETKLATEEEKRDFYSFDGVASGVKPILSESGVPVLVFKTKTGIHLEVISKRAYRKFSQRGSLLIIRRHLKACKDCKCHMPS